MKNKNLWVGYLTQTNKKILVASDDRVDTGNRKTIFLYNQDRNEIVEYSREIIQAKLKDAPAEDYNAEKMAAAYQQALRKAVPNLYRVIFTPNSGGGAKPAGKKSTATIGDDAMGDDIEIDDSFDSGDDDGTEDSIDN